VNRRPLSTRTAAAYEHDWAHFVAWCRSRGVRSLPTEPSTVVAYLDDLTRTRRVSTAQRRLAAIRHAHLDAGHANVTAAAEVQAAVTQAKWRHRELLSTTQPITVEDLRAMSLALPTTMTGLRDRALLLVGYGAALAPRELVRLSTQAVTSRPVALRVALGRGPVFVPAGSAPELCAVDAWRRWRRVAPAGEGPAFVPIDRHGRPGSVALGEKAIGRIVRRAAGRAGLDPDRFSGLSLRRGMVAAATAHGVDEAGIASQTGHRSPRLVRRYMKPEGTVTAPVAAR
jgi:site-specific recombinase XerD